MSIVHVNNPNGTTYVYEQTEAYWDKDKQQSRNKRVCIGKIDKTTGEFVPSKKQLEIQQARLSSHVSKPGPIPTTECRRSQYGATYLFDKIGEKLGIIEDLRKCFPDIYQQIQSIAYYLVIEDRNPMSRFPKWSRFHIHPYGKDIPSQRSSELFGQIGEDAKLKFFKLQCKRRLESEYLAYDTTSISSYSKSLKQVKYGINKDHDPLAQINLAMVFGETTRLPVYYRKLPGNITDVKTVTNLLADVEFLDIGKLKFVMDRGFYSEPNINEMYKKHHKFLIGTKVSLKFVQKKLDECRDTIVSRSHYSSKFEIYYDSFLIDWEYRDDKTRSKKVETENRRMYLHLYYNDQRATDDKIDFNKMLDTLEEELLSGERNTKHEKMYTKYFTIKETPVRGITVTAKQNVIDEAEKNYGFFALVSNGVKDPLDALDIYRSKDVIEKAFGNLKERLNLRRTSVSSEENLEGKLFVQFVALIYLSYIKKAMSEHTLFKDFTMQELIDELDIIECYEYTGKTSRIGEITKKQMHLYDCLGVEVPT